jgi:hypothetical protein
MTAHFKIVPMSVLQESGSWAPRDNVPGTYLQDINKAIERAQKKLLDAQTRLGELDRLKTDILRADCESFINKELRLKIRKILYEPAKG